MNLDRSTYEAWLLDRIEGNLTPEQERELDAFLAANPDLPSGLDTLPNVEDGDVTFSAKDLLKKEYPPAGVPDASRLDDFLVARMEKDLSREQVKQLERYLFEHPEAEQRAKRMAASRVAREPVAFDAKATVERHFPPHGLPDKHRLTDFLIAAEEGDLDVQQRTAVGQYIAAHPQAAHERRLVQAAYLGREAVVFANKEQLKKREARVIALWPRLAAAASIVLVLGLGWWLLRDRSVNEAGIAKNEPQITPKKDEGGSTNNPSEQIEVAPNEVKTTPPVPSEANTTLPREQAPSEGKGTLKETHPAEVPVQPAPSRILDPAPEEPALANVPPPTASEPSPSEQVAQAPAPTGDSGQGQSLGTLVANTVRNEVLGEPTRADGLDGNDALAAVNKGLGALSGGQAGVQAERSAKRDRVQLRLGRGFEISASRGR